MKFGLSNPKVIAVCLTVLNREQALDDLGLSGSRLDSREASLPAPYQTDCGGAAEPSLNGHPAPDPSGISGVKDGKDRR